MTNQQLARLLLAGALGFMSMFVVFTVLGVLSP